MGELNAGNMKWDKEGLQILFSANGTTDGPAVITFNPPELRVQVSEDGNTCKVFADSDIPAGSITCTAPADDPNTEPHEQVSKTVVFTASHSKADDMNATATLIPREEPPTA